MTKELFLCDQATVLAAAKKKWGDGVRVTDSACFVDHEVLRYGISDAAGNLSFGANFWYREGVFR
jgi:hypothetical protein